MVCSMPGFQAKACLVKNQLQYTKVFRRSRNSFRIEPAFLPCSRCDSGPCSRYGDESIPCLRCLRICRPDSGGWCYNCTWIDASTMFCGWDPC